MPLLHQHSGRGPGGGDESRSLMNLLGLDASDASHRIPHSGRGPGGGDESRSLMNLLGLDASDASHRIPERSGSRDDPGPGWVDAPRSLGPAWVDDRQSPGPGWVDDPRQPVLRGMEEPRSSNSEWEDQRYNMDKFVPTMEARRGSGLVAARRRSLMNSVDSVIDAKQLAPMEGSGALEAPRSPAEAHSPRARVPEECFPPRNTAPYASYSETAQPGGGGSVWSAGDNAGPAITDLVSSLKALGAPSAPPATRHSVTQASIHLHLSYDTEQNVYPWPSEPNNNEYVEPATVRLRDRRDPDRYKDKGVLRRASFCGVESTERAPSWSGRLPLRQGADGAALSAKVFIGGLPWETSERSIMHALSHFQPVRVEWPGRETGESDSPRGFAYVTFESEWRVRTLLAACRFDGKQWFYKMTASKHLKTKDVEVIPWSSADTVWSRGGAARLSPARTVFVGALHGMLTAEGLATVMNELFGGVIYAGIDTDKNKYPIGSGRVAFDNVRSYVRAISAAHVIIHTDKFSKKVQVDPYLEDSMCSICNLQQGPYFCREPECYRYYCRWCWNAAHPQDEHRPLMRCTKRTTKANSVSGTSPPPTELWSR